MNKRGISLFTTLGAMAFLAACAGSPRAPSDSMTKPVDLNAFMPKVDTFVVLLDSSDSMEESDGQSDKFQTALDSVASFNQAIPNIDINSGLVLFGKGAGNCTGHSLAKKIYGVGPHSNSGFSSALNSIECTGGSTPSGDAMDLSASAIAEEADDLAVIIFSDFMWDDADAVRSAVATMRGQHGDRLCVYAVKVGGYAENDALIGEITRGNGCGGVVSAADLASPDAMTAYVAETLMAPVPQVEYESKAMSANTLFELNSATLSGAGQAELRELASYISGHGDDVKELKVTGHTCSLGAADYNQGLSERRARAVAEFLAAQGVPSGLMQVSGMGENSPAASNDTREGRAQNRRVEVHIGTVSAKGS